MFVGGATDALPMDEYGGVGGVPKSKALVSLSVHPAGPGGLDAGCNSMFKATSGTYLSMWRGFSSPSPLDTSSVRGGDIEPKSNAYCSTKTAPGEHADRLGVGGGEGVPNRNGLYSATFSLGVNAASTLTVPG